MITWEEAFFIGMTIYAYGYAASHTYRRLKKPTESNSEYFTRIFASYFSLKPGEKITYAATCHPYRGKLIPEQHEGIRTKIAKTLLHYLKAGILDDKSFGSRWYLGLTTNNRIVLAEQPDIESHYEPESEWGSNTRILTDTQAFGMKAEGRPSLMHTGIGMRWRFLLLVDPELERRRGIWVDPHTALVLEARNTQLFTFAEVLPHVGDCK